MLRNKILLQKKVHPIFKVLNSLPKNFLHFFPHLPLLLMSCYVLENLCENLSFFLRIFMLWINWFQCRNDSKSEKFCCRHDYTVSSHNLFSSLFNWFVLLSFVLFHLFLGCTQLQQASTNTICCCQLSHWTIEDRALLQSWGLISFPFVDILKCTMKKSSNGFKVFSKVHIFWEGHKILRNLHLILDWHYIGQN